jgi:ParB/RepB/Spo0J family partition protein
MKLSELEQSRFNKRREYPAEMIEDLANSIKEYGLISRIALRKLSSGKYEVLAGWRRSLALVLNNGASYDLPEADYRILNISDYEAVKLSITENVQRVNLSALDMAEAAKALMEGNPKIKPKEIAAVLWTTEARAKRLMGLEEHLSDLPQVAVDSLAIPDENDPAFTDSHVDAMAKCGAFESLSESQVSDLCDLIISQEVPASRVEGMVNKMTAKDDAAKEAASESAGEAPKGDGTDGTMTDKFNGILVYDEAGDLFLEGKKETKPIDLSYYHPFIREADKFRVHVTAKIKIQPIAP